MAIKLFDAVGIISVNAKGLEKGMKRARGLIDKGFGKIARIAKKAAKVIAVSLVAIAAAATVVGFKILQMGAAAEESENLFEVSLGEMAAEARAWSRELSEAMELNQFQVRKTVGIFNQMFLGFGLGVDEAFELSKAFTKLTADMASFFDISQEEAFQKLQAAISGEIEPLRRLGISMTVAALEAFALSRGIREAFSAMSEAEKTALRYEFIMFKLANAQGDVVRTSGSVTNRMRAINNAITEVGITIGMALQPALKEMLGPLAEVAQKMKQWVNDNTLGIEVLGLQLVGIGRLLIGQLLPDFKGFGKGASNALFAITGKLDKLIQKLLELEKGEILKNLKKKFADIAKTIDIPIVRALVKVFQFIIKGAEDSLTVVDAVLGKMSGETQVSTKQMEAAFGGLFKIMDDGMRFWGNQAKRILDGVAARIRRLREDINSLALAGVPDVPRDGSPGDTKGGDLTIQEVNFNLQGGKDDADAVAKTVLNLLLDLGDAGKMNRAGTQVTP